ncbi:MAG: phosphate signaling complex protein PhoU [Candidatus Nanopelagicaceae bacterium]|jgi:phosphate transport system protein|nr:phosphate signaling complex protein PhoU [Candidatus Nanopelagicaceae bacterium]
MRDAFHDDLNAIGQTLIDMSERVSRAMELATTSLLEADLQLAEQIISDDDVIDIMQHELDAKTLNVLARQQPVAGDLRTLVTSLRMSADLERMGDMTHHIAKIARMRYPSKAVPPELASTIQDMGKVAKNIIDKTTHVLKTHDLQSALELEDDDDEMDKLHRKLFLTLLDDAWPHGIECAIDMTLLGRYYERCADHAVSVARRVYFLVTGEFASEMEER